MRDITGQRQKFLAFTRQGRAALACFAALDDAPGQINRCTLHRARPFEDNTYPRDMRRVTLQDVAPTLDQQAGMIRVNQTNAKAAVAELKRLGFSAIYVNRNGFPDRGKGIEDTLLELGYTKPPIRNATGDLACIVLDK